MPVLKPRTRLVYFRVSEDEFQQFHRACESEGARSLSDLARSAMQRALSGGSNGDEASASARLSKLEGLIGELSTCLDRLSALVEEQSKPKPAERRSPQSVQERVNAQSA